MDYKKQRAFIVLRQRLRRIKVVSPALTIVELPPSLKFRRASLVPNNNVKQGFTIVELLVVIVVIGILAAITIVAYTGLSSKATVASLQSDLSNASTALKLFQITNSNYPDSISTSCSTSTTTILCTKASSGTTFQYIANNTANPQVFSLTATNTSSNTSYTITSTTQPTLGTYRTPGIVTDGLVLNLDAGNTNSYPAPFNSTSWTDLSGYNNHGTLMNGVGYSSGNGGDLTFDGVDDYVNVTDPINNVLDPGSSDFTFSAWVKPSSFCTDWCSVIDKGHYFQTTDGAVMLISSSGILQFALNHMNPYSDDIVSSSATLATGQWYNIVGYKSGNTAYVFVNGVSSGSRSIINISYNVSNSAPLVVGMNSNKRNFIGQIGSTFFYNRALSSSEITQNFNATKSRYGL